MTVSGMTGMQMQDTYDTIEIALTYLSDHWDEQPELGELAQYVGMSEHHLQRVFTRWVGISPKKFLSALTLDQARRRLNDSLSVLHASLDSGLSGPGRLHDLFVTYEAMTPGEYKRQAAGLTIRYGWHATPFGQALLMTTDRGVCGMSFVDDRGVDACFDDMAARWPKARLVQDQAETERAIATIFASPDDIKSGNVPPLRLFLKGTDFQVKVWEALMELPMGALTTYGDIAKQVGISTGGGQAVGNAVGKNPISWLIPCHRVIRNTGELGGYRWGLPRKIAMMGWEAAAAEGD
ncbi:bifunctional helix-turn-helix domain-containing protein/methylated-DNA--[protein]-cysteine S-methyltransferase [Aestuariispira ectoiniformans]|uniref:bifunctional helix-turn-helix domain-containing protein/methylated-DNA--[protein]-cysteine S-methyltransferase n=1 Tax=Aestuariispira ectoiniformans TaxID=2775080 RepID=UPI00223AC98B|nr:bifunctional helix-turn-helix domain-containing protein/methylated-DNA--[protein]-cysteine S-methyltransferase [Aestuariispira ectoiniformans]